MLEAASACDRLQLTRAANVRANDTVTFRSTFDALPDPDLDDVIAGLERVQQAYADWLVPIERAELLELLADFADMLQVSAPSEGGVDLYLEAMAGMPANLVPIARVKVARSHRFARLPLPADFEKAIAGELAWCEARISWVKHMLLMFNQARALRDELKRRDPS